MFVVASLALTSLAQGPRVIASAGAKVAETRIRDLAPARAESVGMSAERLGRLDAVMRHLVDDKQVAGLVTLVERHGKIVHFNAVGQFDVRKPDPVQKDSIFRIDSMTKPITGVAMMMLYEEGKWQRNDPVSRYIPEFTRSTVYAGKNQDGTPKLEDLQVASSLKSVLSRRLASIASIDPAA